MKTNTMTVNGNTVKFFRNGIKVNGSKLIKGWFSHTEAWSNAYQTIAEHVTFFERSYYREGPALCTVFEHAENNSESMTDYFEQTHANIYPGEPCYQMALAMAKEETEYRAARKTAQMANWYAKRGLTAPVAA